MNTKLLFKGNISANNIVINDTKKKFFIPGISEDNINQLWYEFLRDAKSKNKKVWDAPLYRLENIEFINKKILLNLGTIYAKEVAVVNSYLTLEDLNHDKRIPKNIFVASLIKTIDNMYLFGKKSGISVGDPRIDIIGGALSRSEIKVENGHSILTALYNELREEANIPLNAIVSSSLIGVILSPVNSVGIIWHSELSITMREAIKKFNINNDGELSMLHFVPASELEEFLQAQSSYLSFLVNLLA